MQDNQTMKERICTILRWTEKYTKTDMSYLLEGGFWLSLGQIISSGSALILTVIFANLASAETYGTYRYILAIAAIFSICSLPGMGTALSRAVAKNYDNDIHEATKTKIRYSLLGTFFASIGSLYYFLNSNSELSLALLLIAISLPVFDTFTLYSAYLLGKKRFDLHTRYQFLTQVISTACLILVITINQNIIVILSAYFIPLISTRIFFYLKTTKGIDFTKSADENDLKTLAFGKHLTIMSLPSVFATQIDKILMWKFFGPVQLATYAIALAIPTQLQGLLKRADALALPKLSTSNAKPVDIFRKWFVFTLFTIPIVIVYVLFAPYVFYVFLPQYSEAIVYSQLLSIVIALAPKTILRAYIEAKGHSSRLYLFHTITSITKMLLMVFLIPSLGLYGAVWAIVINEFISLILISVLLLKKA
jgi:O-antigen/teichoic acid export membrane protein